VDAISHPLPGRLWIIRLGDLLAFRINKLVETWSRTNRFGLGDQFVRAIDSVSANIAEGYARMHVKERLHFFSIARGSLEESIRHLRRAKERNLVSALEAFTLYELMIKLSKSLEHFVETQTPRG
jgi:four helix bundle protein